MNFIYLWDSYTMKQQLHIIIGTSNHTWQANWDIGAFLIKTHLAPTQSVENVYLGMLKIKKLIIWQRQTCMAANEVYSNTYTLKLLLKPALTEVQRLEKEATRTLSINSVGLKTYPFSSLWCKFHAYLIFFKGKLLVYMNSTI